MQTMLADNLLGTLAALNDYTWVKFWINYYKYCRMEEERKNKE